MRALPRTRGAPTVTSANRGRARDDRATEVAVNRALWAVLNERFTDAAADTLWSRTEVVWGLFSVPDRLLGVLGDVGGLDVVELACGTAYFSSWLTAAGAKTVALDLSGEQLATARRLQGRVGPVFPLVQADAERVPLLSGRFDLVVSEHGPPHGVTRSAGCLRRRECCARAGAWSSLPTAFCRRCACRPARGSPRNGSCEASAMPIRCAGREAESSSTPLTGTGYGCCAGPVSSWRRCTRSTRQGLRRPPLLRDRVGRMGNALARRGAVGGYPFDSGRHLSQAAFCLR